MPGYVALLRGVNVGGHNRVPMATLKDLLTALGYTDVRTHLQSGNALFTASESAQERLASAIEDAIQQALHLSIRCLVRTGPDLQGVIAANPFTTAATDPSRLVALFLSGNPDPVLVRARDPMALSPDTIRFGDGVIYQWCPDGISNAPLLVPFIERHLKLVATARNWNTVTRLSAMLDE